MSETMKITRRNFSRALLAMGGCAFGPAPFLNPAVAGDELSLQIKARLNLKPIGDDVQRVPVYGISEWFCYHGDYGLDFPDNKIDTIIEDTIDLQRAIGIDHMVWNCGRSTLDYWSELPDSTRMCELADKVGSKSWEFVARVMERFCPLRRAIVHCRKLGMPILGRLGMNRHYGSVDYSAVASRFALENSQYRERAKDGGEISGKLCYAIPEVQRERIDILLEIQRIDVDGLVLDYCRQMPILRYHEALVGPYIAKTGVDPRKIDSTNPDDFKDWFQYRADVLTGFMRKLRLAVRAQEVELGRPCPILARIPDSPPWLMIAWGLDVEQWFKEDLIDATMLSPFPRCREDPNLYPEHHIAMAHRYGRACIGGIGSKGLIRDGDLKKILSDTSFFHPKPVYQLADRQYRAGADAISLYQTETMARMDYLKPTLKELGDRELVARRAAELPEPQKPLHSLFGMDWHARLENGETLRSDAGAYAL